MKEKLKKSEKKEIEKKKHGREHTTDYYAGLKKSGIAIEQQINQHIQSLLNNKDLVKAANQHSDLITNNIRSLQKYVEVLSTILQIPTKNDVANVAKLTIQTEEKVDQLDERIMELTNTIQNSMSDDFHYYKDDISNDSKGWKWSRSIRRIYQ